MSLSSIKLGMKSPTFGSDTTWLLRPEVRVELDSALRADPWITGEDSVKIAGEFGCLRMLKVRQMHLEIARKKMLTTWVGPGSWMRMCQLWGSSDPCWLVGCEKFWTQNCVPQENPWCHSMSPFFQLLQPRPACQRLTKALTESPIELGEDVNGDVSWLQSPGPFSSLPGKWTL